MTDSSKKDPNHSKKPSNEVDLEIEDQEIVHSIEHGVMDDKLNYRRLAFWTTLGIAIFVIFIISIVNLFDYNKFLTTEKMTVNAEYTEINDQRERDSRLLNSFGVVDKENKVYRIPIDSAINQLAEERQ